MIPILVALAGGVGTYLLFKGLGGSKKPELVAPPPPPLVEQATIPNGPMPPGWVLYYDKVPPQVGDLAVFRPEYVHETGEMLGSKPLLLDGRVIEYHPIGGLAVVEVPNMLYWRRGSSQEVHSLRILPEYPETSLVRVIAQQLP